MLSRSYNAVWKWEKRLRNTFDCKCSVSMYLVDHVYTFGSWLHTVIESIICTQIKDMTRTFDNYSTKKKQSTW